MEDGGAQGTRHSEMQTETQEVMKCVGECEAYDIPGTVNGTYNKMSQSGNISQKMRPYQRAHYIIPLVPTLGDEIRTGQLCLGNSGMESVSRTPFLYLYLQHP